MYQPGLDQLARIRYQELLDEAAQERAARQQRNNEPGTAFGRLTAALTALIRRPDNSAKPQAVECAPSETRQPHWGGSKA